MKKEKETKSELESLQDNRDNATNDKSRKQAQNKIDEYFLGRIEKKKKKEKKKKVYIEEDSDFLDF